MRSDADRIGDILEAITKIKERIPREDEAFLRDEMIQVWVIHHLQVIGEAARGVSQATRARYPEVPWGEIVALRNILVHEYFGLNLLQLWNMARKDLIELEIQMRRIHPEIGGGPDGVGG